MRTSSSQTPPRAAYAAAIPACGLFLMLGPIVGGYTFPAGAGHAPWSQVTLSEIPAQYVENTERLQAPLEFRTFTARRETRHFLGTSPSTTSWIPGLLVALPTESGQVDYRAYDRRAASGNLLHYVWAASTLREHYHFPGAPLPAELGRGPWLAASCGDKSLFDLGAEGQPAALRGTQTSLKELTLRINDAGDIYIIGTDALEFVH